ncbi:PucR family transcriptional regulator [Paeniglutamicibacter sp. NPDC012692]|uniref:PucR family transcriptional regulator n=1 Tax=Paeniglutamicibacter sp. NPDC012692 TaxID=3364388 RepID=UPI0036AE8337
MTSIATAPDSITIHALLRAMASPAITLRSHGAPPKLSLVSPTLHDPHTELEAPAGSILLGLGLHPAEPKTMEVIRKAAVAGFGAVIIKQYGRELGATIAAADQAGIALLTVDDEMGWLQLDALVGSALNASAEADSSLSTLGVGDLFALANAIAAMVGGATTIENLQEQILGYSTLPHQPIDDDRRQGILGRQVPFLPENAAQYASVFRSRGAVRVKGVDDAMDRLAIAVRAGKEPLGSIWVVDVNGDLDSAAERALVRAADIAALHMLRARSAYDLARQQRADLLRKLMEGGDDATLVAEQLGLRRSGPFVVAAFQPAMGQASEMALTRLLDLVTTECETYRGGAHCVLVGTTVYALFASTDPSPFGPVEALARRVTERSRVSLAVDLRVATGSAVMTVSDINRSRHEADMVLFMLTSGNDSSSYACAQDVRSRLALLELASHFRKLPHLLSPAAGKIAAHDAESNTEYAKTLRTYLDCSRDSARTSAALSLHQNTLRYRLKRLRDLFGVDLDQPEDTLLLWLSLHVLEFS